jgi:hypothetical protein
MCPGPFNVTLQATVGLRSLQGAALLTLANECQSQTLPQRISHRTGVLRILSQDHRAGGDNAAAAQAAALQGSRATLRDGRLAVGTHLPLLAKRYRYLSLLGEGASAQVPLPAKLTCNARRARTWGWRSCSLPLHGCSMRLPANSRLACQRMPVTGRAWVPGLRCLLWRPCQVILAEDTLRAGQGQLVAIKVMKRQFGYAGQKVCAACAFCLS